MARPILETPILFGEDARRFERKMQDATCTLSQQEKDELMSSYKAVFAALERGEASRKARLSKRMGTTK